MQCRNLIGKLEELAPRRLACDWDNPGLLAGWEDRKIHRVLVALDATDVVVEQAVREQADMLLTHHPMIFKPLKQINDQSFTGRRLLDLIGNGISCYAMHTNFDIAPGCMADLAAERLGLIDGVPLEVTGEEDGKPVGIGKVGLLREPVTLKKLAQQVKEAFGIPFVTVYGMETGEGPVSRVAISPGSGGSMLRYGIAAGAQVLVTGDIGHHEGIDAVADHMAVIDAGHYGLEHIFIPFIKDYLEQVSGGELEVITAAPAFPAVTV